MCGSGVRVCSSSLLIRCGIAAIDHNHTQEQWAAGGRRDMEEDPAEAGIGDQDGLDEQVPFRDWQMVGMV